MTSLYKLKIDTKISIRYHAKRMRFFDNFHNIASIGSVMSGTSAFAALFSNGDHNILALYLTGIVATLSGLDQVLAFSKRATVHDDLRKKLSNLLKDIISSDDTEENVKRLEGEQVLIQSEEPTRLKILSIHCHNEECIALGYDGNHLFYLGKRTLLKDWWSFENYGPISLTEYQAMLEAKKANKRARKS